MDKKSLNAVAEAMKGLQTALITLLAGSDVNEATADATPAVGDFDLTLTEADRLQGQLQDLKSKLVVARVLTRIPGLKEIGVELGHEIMTDDEGGTHTTTFPRRFTLIRRLPGQGEDVTVNFDRDDTLLDGDDLLAAAAFIGVPKPKDRIDRLTVSKRFFTAVDIEDLDRLVRRAGRSCPLVKIYQGTTAATQTF